jgi:biopolymer transport protein ExbB/TolQ
VAWTRHGAKGGYVLAVIPIASIEDSVFSAVKVLRVPVLILALCALLIAVVEMGSLWIELWRRRGQRRRSLEGKAAARQAHDALAAGDRDRARASIDGLASSADMWVALQQLVNDATDPAASDWMSKTIADFDLRSVKRLERTRVLVRAGPALGLMGTLIPLSPALQGLAQGHIQELTSNLRVAFSVTVVGLLTGAIAFWVSMVRDRLYSQDVSDLETVAAELERLAPAGAPVTMPPIAVVSAHAPSQPGDVPEAGLSTRLNIEPR